MPEWLLPLVIFSCFWIPMIIYNRKPLKYFWWNNIAWAGLFIRTGLDKKRAKLTRLLNGTDVPQPFANYLGQSPAYTQFKRGTTVEGSTLTYLLGKIGILLYAFYGRIIVGPVLLFLYFIIVWIVDSVAKLVSQTVKHSKKPS